MTFFDQHIENIVELMHISTEANYDAVWCLWQGNINFKSCIQIIFKLGKTIKTTVLIHITRKIGNIHLNAALSESHKFIDLRSNLQDKITALLGKNYLSFETKC